MKNEYKTTWLKPHIKRGLTPIYGPSRSNGPSRSRRFIDHGDGTVTDTETDLIWLKDASPFLKSSWGRVTYLCRDLSFAEHPDWRLPSVEELISLVNYNEYNPALSKDHPFIDVQSAGYWSSNTYASSTGFAWLVSMGNGGISNDYKSNIHYVWPVRGRQ